MAVIQQGNTYKTVIGWYGDCDDECQDLNLSAYKSQLTAVYQWDNGGALKVWKSNLPDALNRSFKSLECGKIYYLYVKPGTGSFTVPNFVVSSYETQDAGRVAASCQPTPTPERTPTPIPCNCASSDYTIIKPTSQNYVTNGHTFGAFESGTTIAYKPETLQSTLASEVSFIYPNGVTAGIIVFTSKKPANTEFIVQRGITCYTATATESNKVDDDKWELNLVVSEQLSDKCGDEQPLTTPTPKPATYSLSANPTSVSEGQSFSVVLNTANVEDGATIPYTITGIEASDISQSLTGNFTINSNNASQTFNVVADQLTEGTQTFKLKLNNNLAEVSVVVQDTSKTQPTPTPKPPSECCPSNTTSYNTNGEFEETQIKITLPGDSLSTTVAEYKGWANGGKLCIDMTDMGNSQDNSQTNTERYYILPGLPSGSIPTGTIARQYNNGKNTFYYVAPDGSCYTGNYDDGGVDPNNPVVLTKTTGSFDPDPTPTPKPVPTYSLSANPTSVAEGSNFSVLLQTENVENGTTIPYTITGVEASDISQSLTGNFTISGGGDTKLFTVVADQLTEGNQTFKLTLNNNQASVSVVIQDTSKTQPTPTPEAQSGECCTSDTTSYNTNGEMGGTQIKMKLPGDDMETTVVEYKLWEAGGKLCIDMTDMGNSQDNSQTNTERYYILPGLASDALPTGTIARQYNNGKNTFYYTRPNGDCFMGEYSDQGENWEQPVVLTKVNTTSQPDPTPTPVAPTPTPEKPNQLAFRWASVNVQGEGTREVLQVKNILKPTNANFDSRDTINKWSTVYGFTGNDGSYSLSNAFWPDAAVSANYNDHFSTISFDGLQFSLGSEETDGTIGKYKQLKVSLSGEVEFSHDSNESSPSALFIYKEDNANSDNSAIGASASWPVIVKKLDPTPTPKPQNDDPTPTPADCSCIPSGYTSVEISSSSVVNASGGHVLAEFEKGSIVAWDSSTLVNGFDGIFFKLPNNSSGGMIMFNGKVPKNTNFYYKTSTGCYKATVGDDQKTASGYMVTWTLVRELPSACEDASFNEEINCCTDSETNINVFLGKGEPQNGISGVLTQPDGRMDGNLCFTATPVNNVSMELPHIVYLENQPSDMAFKIELSRDYEGIKFIYRLKTGECYEGYLNSSYTATFTEII